MRELRVALLQIAPGENLLMSREKGIQACRKAKKLGADIALFPEMWSSGYVFPHDEEWLKKNSVSLDSAYVKRFSGLARELQMAIAITLLEKHEPNPRNTVCLFDRHGKLVYRYSKVHIFFWSRTLIFLTPPSRKISALPESFSAIRISA